MKILLLKEVPKLGRKGEIKEVSEGYAKNFLIPKKIALAATSQIILEQRQKSEKEERIHGGKIKFLDEILPLLEKHIFSFRVRAGTHGEIFSSVHQKEIEDAVLSFIASHGGRFAPEEISFPFKPIKELGEKTVPGKIGRGDIVKQARIRIEISPEEK